MKAGRAGMRGMLTVLLPIGAVLGLLLGRDTLVPAEARSATASPQAPAEETVGVRVRIEAVGTERDGATGRPRTAGGGTLPLGRSSTWFVSAGHENLPTLCGPYVSREPAAGALFVWKVETTALDVKDGRPTLRIHWTRSSPAEPEPQRDDTRTITLQPGDVHVLDFIDSPDATSSCASLLLRVSADPVGPQFSRRFVADLWAVDEGAAQDARSAHVRVNGTGAATAQYEFPPADLQSLFREAPGTQSLSMRLAGTIQAVLTADGFVTVTLTTERQFVTAKGSAGGRGRAVFRARVGETAAVLLPDPPAHLGTDPTVDSIDLARLFAGRHLSVYVRVDAAR